MSGKKVTFAKPKPVAPAAVDPEGWIRERGTALPDRPSPVPMKRLTIDIPAQLHGRIKAGCAIRGIKMADLLRAYLESEFPEP